MKKKKAKKKCSNWDEFVKKYKFLFQQLGAAEFSADYSSAHELTQAITMLYQQEFE